MLTMIKKRRLLPLTILNNTVDSRVTPSLYHLTTLVYTTKKNMQPLLRMYFFRDVFFSNHTKKTLQP